MNVERTENPIDVSTHGPDGHWDHADIARLCALRDRQAQEIERLKLERDEAIADRDHSDALCSSFITERDRLSDRLRAALETVASRFDETYRPGCLGRILGDKAREVLGAFPASETEKEHG